MKFRQLTYVFFLTVLSLSVSAQKPRVMNDPTHDDKPIHFGFSLGMNTMDYRIQLSEQAIRERVYVGIEGLTPGINIHAIANLRLSEYFDLRTLPGISFGERYIHFRYLPDPDSAVHPGNDPYKAESSYLELPLLLKYKSKRLNNFRPYLIGGANIRYDLAVKREYIQDEQEIMVSKPDYYAEIGYGMDFYLTYFKMGVEIKYSLGFANILLREDRHGELPVEFARYTNYIDKITSHLVILSFHFE